MMDISEHDFGGRLCPKDDEQISWENLVDLPNVRMAVVYKRQSRHEQVRKHVWSLQAQGNLVDLAREDGYFDELIHVEERDLGISGTKGREDRPGLSHLIDLTEAGKVEAVYVVHISRLYRDQTLINALALGELFKKHGVIIVTPQMRLNLRDKMHMRLYRMEVERAADELELMSSRLIGAQELKVRAGFYGGEKLSPGYIVDDRKELDNGEPNPNYHGYIAYQPHAEVVKTIFERLAMGMTPTQVARDCKRQGIVFPFFPPTLDTPANHKVFLRSKRSADGWIVTATQVRTIGTNPAYIGWRIWGGEVISKGAFPPIVDEAAFWAVQEQFNGKRSRPKKDNDPLPLAGLLYCGDHDVPRRMTYSNRPGGSLYQCIENDLKLYCAHITHTFLDDPISEAVISQITLPGLADEILDKLTDKYEQAKEQAASYHREMKRLEAEVENLRGNLASSVLSADQLRWIDQQVRERLARLRELADLESKPIGAVVGYPVPGQADIELVKLFLQNLGDRWASQPNGLKNAFLRLVLDKVFISRYTSLTTRVRLIWQVGLEQELLIHRQHSGQWQAWDDSELETLKVHYETASREDLMALLPGRTWRAIRNCGGRLGLSRSQHAGLPKGTAWRPFTPDEDDLVRRYYASEIGTDEVLSTGRTMDAIRIRARLLGLKRPRRVTWEWIPRLMSEQACWPSRATSR